MQLKKLTKAAMLLLIDDSAVSAATLDDRQEINYRFTNYSEQEINGVDRYNIDIQQFRLYQPIDDELAVTISAVYETMSGASPWYVVPDANGKPIQIMSGATIKEQRKDVSITGSKQIGSLNISASVGKSTENDYTASYARLVTENSLENKITSVFSGITASDDILNPTQSTTETRIERAEKSSRGVYVGITRVINKNLLFSSSLSYTSVNGFLSDPYKQAYTLDGNEAVKIVNDNRPNTKTQFAWSAKMRYHLGDNVAWHNDFRYFKDSWEITSQTISSTLFETIAAQWQLSQELRYYNQSRAYFYAPFYNGTRADGLHSSDYRLSPFGAISGRIKIKYSTKNIAANIAIEKYSSSGSLALKQVKIENPALVNFLVLTIGVDVKFD